MYNNYNYICLSIVFIVSRQHQGLKQNRVSNAMTPKEGMHSVPK